MRHRLAGKPDRPVRGRKIRNVSERSGMVQLHVTMTDFATRTDQSFLIMSGDSIRVQLTAYLEGPGHPRVLTVPVTVTARVT